jgi:uncharacterized membrane protein
MVAHGAVLSISGIMTLVIIGSVVIFLLLFFSFADKPRKGKEKPAQGNGEVMDDSYAEIKPNVKGATASMLLGIAGLPFVLLPFVNIVSFVLGILAIAFGIAAKKTIRQSGDFLQGNGYATAGIAFGIADILLSVTVLLIAILFFE